MRSADPMETIEIEGARVLIETEAVVLCVVRERELWLPRDQVLNLPALLAGATGTLVVSRRLALVHGLV